LFKVAWENWENGPVSKIPVKWGRRIGETFYSRGSEAHQPCVHAVCLAGLSACSAQAGKGRRASYRTDYGIARCTGEKQERPEGLPAPERALMGVQTQRQRRIQLGDPVRLRRVHRQWSITAKHFRPHVFKQLQRTAYAVLGCSPGEPVPGRFALPQPPRTGV